MAGVCEMLPRAGQESQVSTVCVLDNTNVRLSPPAQLHHCRRTLGHEWWPAAGALLHLDTVKYDEKLAKWAKMYNMAKKCSTHVQQDARNAPDFHCS